MLWKLSITTWKAIGSKQLVGPDSQVAWVNFLLIMGEVGAEPTVFTPNIPNEEGVFFHLACFEVVPPSTSVVAD